LYIDEDNFYKLQFELQQRKFALKRNARLKKFEAVVGDVEVDIYTPFMCNLVVPCSEVFSERLYSVIEEYKVAIPEVLILLKAQAAQQRWNSEKGIKDRTDIISILSFVDLKVDLLRKLLEKYDRQQTLLKLLKRIVTESRIEYRFLGLKYERDGVQLRERFHKLLEW
jgi:hypothetical protein